VATERSCTPEAPPIAPKITDASASPFSMQMTPWRELSKWRSPRIRSPWQYGELSAEPNVYAGSFKISIKRPPPMSRIIDSVPTLVCFRITYRCSAAGAGGSIATVKAVRCNA